MQKMGYTNSCARWRWVHCLISLPEIGMGLQLFFTTLPLSTSVVNFCVTLLGSVSSSSRTCLIFVNRRSVRVLEKSSRITTRSTLTCWASGGMV
ncbi:hypothetical protein ACET3Z_003121 [Daucus carota]